MAENRNALSPWQVQTRAATERLIAQGFLGVVLWGSELGIVIGAGFWSEHVPMPANDQGEKPFG